MKKNSLLISILLFLFSNVYAKKVEIETAKIVGINFLTSKINSKETKGISNLQLVYTGNYDQSQIAYYVFNSDNNSFVIVSADDVVSPILAYSDKGIFDSNNIPPNVKEWLDCYAEQIKIAKTNNISSSYSTSLEWEGYIAGNFINTKTTTLTVNPLLQTTWDQNCYYNELCPAGAYSCGHVPTGCAATAMAQIMKYWNYPAYGLGSHSYNHSTYGTLSANFGTTNYDWCNMPNNLSNSNNAIATLMYHCGVSVNMNYNPSGSSATLESAANAFKTYFRYSNNIQCVYRSNYTEAAWINLMKTELNAGRPIEYAGNNSSGGHGFVCDGYDNQNYFHFNWGWGGDNDGYFNINNLINGYNNSHRAIIKIEPLPAPFNSASKWVSGWDVNNGWDATDLLRCIADVNGDGKGDIVGFGIDGVYVALSNGSSFGTQQKWNNGWSRDQGWGASDLLRCIADVNGDGKGDIVGFGIDGVYVALSNGSSFGTQQKWNNGWSRDQGWGASDLLRCIADVNGDGKGDIVGFGVDGVYIALSNGFSFGTQQKWNNGWCRTQGWGASDLLRCIADVNGDSKGDIVGFGVDGVYIAFSNGSSFGSQEKWSTGWSRNEGWGASDNKRCVADINGDNKTDIVGFTCLVYEDFSNGNSFLGANFATIAFSNLWGWDNSGFLRCVEDVNGDNKADIIGFGQDGVYVSISNNNSLQETNLISNKDKINENSLNERDNLNISLKIYPNPTNGNLNVNIIGEYQKIEIKDIYGKTIFQTDQVNNSNQFDLSAYSKGLYFILLYKPNKEVEVNKVILN